MAKKSIGIEIGQQTVRVATVTMVKGVPLFTGAREQQVETVEERSRVLAAMLGDVAFGDRVATSLSAVGSYYRLLEFPFGEAKKLEPAVELEMGTQLPTTHEVVCDFLAPHHNGHGFAVPSAAVKRVAVTEMLAVFQQAEQPLQLLDLNPFAFAAGLEHVIPEGVLVVVQANEMTVSHVKSGDVLAFRTMPRRSQDSADQLALMIHRDYLTMGRAGEVTLDLFLMGEGAGVELCRALEGMGLTPRYPEVKIEGQQMAPAMLVPAVLALRAAQTTRVRRFNFLKGDLAPKNEWEGFRLRLLALAALAAMIVVTLASGAYLNYGQQQKRAETLKAESVALFRQTFPQVRTIVDVPSQMQSNLAELREKVRFLGLAQGRSPLNVLREISERTPQDIRFTVRELLYSDDQLHIDGSTPSFESINRLAEALDVSPLFEQIQIADARMGSGDGRVDFRLNIKNSDEETP